MAKKKAEPKVPVDAGAEPAPAPSPAFADRAAGKLTPSTVWVEDAVWALLVEAYRDRPGSAAFAAQHANVTRATALAAWERGMVKRGLPPRPPIQDVLRDEMEAARAARINEETKLLQQDELRRLDAKRDALEARKEEMQLAKVSRRNALMVGVAVHRLASLVDKVAGEIQSRVNKNLATIPTEELFRIVRHSVYVARVAGLVTEQTLRIERIVAGEPTEWVGLKTDGVAAGDVLRELDSLASAIRSQIEGTRAITLPSVAGVTPKKPGDGLPS